MNDELLKVKKHIGKKIYPEFLGYDDAGFRFITSPMNIRNQPLNRCFRE